MEGVKFVGDKILLPSDRSGYTKLYIYNMNGQLQRTIGDGNYDITSVYGYDPKTGDVYYQAAALGATDRQVYVTHKNGKTVRLTDREGWNTAFFSGDFQYNFQGALSAIPAVGIQLSIGERTGVAIANFSAGFFGPSLPG